MMLPAALPVFLLYRCCLYRDTRRTGKLPCFRAAYAVVWTGFGLLMILAQATGESGGLLDPMPLTQGLESTAITRWPEVDALARTLREGEFGGPVVNGDLAIWVYVENFEDGTGRSLYDLQHEIQERLANERFAAEQKKYLADLFARGNMDDFNNMTYLLLDIAIQRWARPE